MFELIEVLGQLEYELLVLLRGLCLQKTLSCGKIIFLTLHCCAVFLEEDQANIMG